jgi:predicted transcriptional regulator
MPANPVLAFRCEPELAERIDDRARAEHRSRSNLVQLAVQRYVQQAERDAEQEPKAAA